MHDVLDPNADEVEHNADKVVEKVADKVEGVVKKVEVVDKVEELADKVDNAVKQIVDNVNEVIQMEEAQKIEGMLDQKNDSSKKGYYLGVMFRPTQLKISMMSPCFT